MDHVILKAKDLDGYLIEQDRGNIEQVNAVSYTHLTLPTN